MHSARIDARINRVSEMSRQKIWHVCRVTDAGYVPHSLLHSYSQGLGKSREEITHNIVHKGIGHVVTNTVKTRFDCDAES